MKIVIAMDSFKGSLSSAEAGLIAKNAALRAEPTAEVKVVPLADGGEGTVDALTEGLGGEIMRVNVTGPLEMRTLLRRIFDETEPVTDPRTDKFNLIASRYGRIGRTAVIEMADAAGLTLAVHPMPLVNPMAASKKFTSTNPLNTTTFGLGELILRAIDDGCREFIIGIGGSATNDCGLGMLTALGFKFMRSDGRQAGVYGRDLADIVSIDRSNVDARLKNCRFRIACDVNNPLTGPNGCSYVYGPQKGATPEIVEQMDGWIEKFSALAIKTFGIDRKSVEGDGAAGGMGFAFRTFLGGELIKGVDLILDAIKFRDVLKGADVLLTGEGRIDAQTAMGKAPTGAAKLAKSIDDRILTVALCGCVGDGASSVHDAGIDAYFSILNRATTAEEAMMKEAASKNLSATVEEIVRLLRAERIIRN